MGNYFLKYVITDAWNSAIAPGPPGREMAMSPPHVGQNVGARCSVRGRQWCVGLPEVCRHGHLELWKHPRPPLSTPLGVEGDGTCRLRSLSASLLPCTATLVHVAQSVLAGAVQYPACSRWKRPARDCWEATAVRKRS